MSASVSVCANRVGYSKVGIYWVTAEIFVGKRGWQAVVVSHLAGFGRRLRRGQRFE